MEWNEETCRVGRIPALLAHPEDPQSDGVVLLHGLHSRKEAQLKELRALARLGFRVLCPDAPGHGERDDGRLARLEALPSERWHEAFLEIVNEAVDELELLGGRLFELGATRVALVGISMGACTALAAPTRGRTFSAVASILGTPELMPRGDAAPTERLRQLLDQAPAHRPSLFDDLPLLLANAGRDEAVPPEPARRFAATLRARSGARHDHPLVLEYPDSGHFMRPQDWEHLWNEVEAFLSRNLGP